MHQVKIPLLSVFSQFDDIQILSEVFSALVKLPSLSSIWEFLSSQSLKYLQKNILLQMVHNIIWTIWTKWIIWFNYDCT